VVGRWTSIIWTAAYFSSALRATGLFFLHRWYQARRPFDVLIGVIGLAISAGTKLHVTFYMPLLAVIAFVLTCHHRAVWAEVRGWLSIRGGCSSCRLATEGSGEGRDPGSHMEAERTSRTMPSC
jgi:hypothetical protein